MILFNSDDGLYMVKTVKRISVMGLRDMSTKHIVSNAVGR